MTRKWYRVLGAVIVPLGLLYGAAFLSGPLAAQDAKAKPVAEKPAAEKPAAEKPAAEKPAAEKPAAEHGGHS